MQELKRFERLWSGWQTVGVIGEGTNGKVYEMVNGSRHMALKHVFAPCGDEEQRSALEREIKILNELSDSAAEDHITCLYDADRVEEEDGVHCFLWFDRLITLDEYIDRYTINLSEVIWLGLDACSALESLRARGIVHRDIKGENIYSTTARNGGFLLGDFGCASYESEDVPNVGTPNYMAPEVLLGEKATHASDIYSLGLVLYKLLNGGRLPFLPQNAEHEDYAKALERRKSGKNLPVPVNAPDELAAVVLKACAFDKKERYQTAGEMEKELNRVRALTVRS